jgi:hypothetical protein
MLIEFQPLFEPEPAEHPRGVRSTSARTLAAFAVYAAALATTACTVQDTDATGSSTTEGTQGSEGTPLPPSPIVCQPPCSTGSDCCPPADELPPGMTCPGDYPLNVACSDAGTCTATACSSDDDCTAGGPQLRCIGDGPTARCVQGCELDSDCLTPTRTCSGEVDGATFCVSNEDPFACEGDAECEEGGFGRCIEGRCGCESNADCTDGWRCPAA